MNVERLIKDEALKLKSSRRKIEIAPDISAESVEKIKKKYKKDLEVNFEKYILVMSYTKIGWFFLSGDSLMYDNYMQNGINTIEYKEVSSVSVKVGGRISPDKVIVELNNGKTLELDAAIDGINLSVFADVFRRIIDCAQKAEDEVFTRSEQGILSCELPSELKLMYLKILCNYAYVNDQIIDPDEYNLISKFSIRMELEGDERGKLREYMNEPEKREKSGSILKKIFNFTENQTGYWDTVKYSLVQDAICLHDIQNPESSWREDGFIGSLMEKFNLTPEQLDVMCRAVELNNQMAKKDADMNKLRKEWKAFIQAIQGTTKYVPALYLFCSGSVYGITSFEAFLKKEGTKQKDISKQRELILHNLIENNQKTINVLVGDMNYLAEKLEIAMKNEMKIKEQYKEVQKLINRIKSAMKNVGQE